MRIRAVVIASLVGGATFLSGVGWISAGAAIRTATVTQTYTCKAAGQTETAPVTISGTAVISGTGSTATVQLSDVVFSVTNTFGVTAVGSSFKLYIPDPNKTSAPYKAGSAKA